MLHDLVGSEQIQASDTECRHVSVLLRERDLRVAASCRQHGHWRRERDAVGRGGARLALRQGQADDAVVDGVRKVGGCVQSEVSGSLNVRRVLVLRDDLEAANLALLDRVIPAGTGESDWIVGRTTQRRVVDLEHLGGEGARALRHRVLVGRSEARGSALHAAFERILGGCTS